jgi:hypothetical protein
MVDKLGYLFFFPRKFSYYFAVLVGGCFCLLLDSAARRTADNMDLETAPLPSERTMISL